MSDPGHDAALLAASDAARAWLDSVPGRPVRAEATAREMLAAFSEPLPEEGMDPADVVRDLAARAEPGLLASGSPRFFAWVIGGALPAAIAADWLVSAWDQNTGMAEPIPATTMLEQVTAGWILDLLDLPREASVGFVTGGQMASTTCLAAARNHVLAAHGWDVERDGLQGAPRVNVLVGEERHDTIDIALRVLGLGASTATVVAADEAGRMRPDALAATAARVEGPTIVCCRSGTSTGAPLTRWARSSRPCGGTTCGCTLTAPSGSGPGPLRPTGTSWPGSSAPTRGPPTPTSGSTRPTTAAWPSAATPPPTAAPWACGPPTCRRAPTRTSATRSTTTPSSRAAPGRRRSGRPCASSGAGGWPSSWSAAARWPSGSPPQLSEADGVEVLHQDLNQVVVRFLDPQGRDHDAHSRAVVARTRRRAPAIRARRSGGASAGCASR